VPGLGLSTRPGARRVDARPAAGWLDALLPARLEAVLEREQAKREALRALLNGGSSPAPSEQGRGLPVGARPRPGLSAAARGPSNLVNTWHLGES
jgi:hypothetical protein